MKPILFECSAVLSISADEICAGIADTERWSTFKGYLILPGITRAGYEKRTEQMVGSRIRVRSTDGSDHIEEILQWVPDKIVVLKLSEFTPPLSHLADHFIEEWHFEAKGANATRVTRRFRMVDAQPLTRPVLWLISLLFRKAIERQLAEMAALPHLHSAYTSGRENDAGHLR